MWAYIAIATALMLQATPCFAAAGTGSAKYNDLESIPLACSAGALNMVTGEAHGLNNCIDFILNLNRELGWRVGNIIAHYYEGKQLVFQEDHSRPVCIESRMVVAPVCVLSNEESENHNNERCGIRSPRSTTDGYCQFTRDGIDMKSCGKEYAWFSGLKARVWHHYYEMMTAEILGSKIRLSKFVDEKGSEFKPCLEYAKAIQRVLYDQAPDDYNPEATENYIKPRDPMLAENIKNKKFTNGYYTVQDALGFDLGVDDVCRIDPYYMHLSLDPNDNEKAGGQAKLSACRLQTARTHIGYLYTELATCELHWRTRDALYRYSRFADFMEDWEDQVVEPCAVYVSKMGLLSEHAIIDAMQECYAKGAPGNKSVKAYFQSLYEAMPVAGPMPVLKIIPDKQLSECPVLKAPGEGI